MAQLLELVAKDGSTYDYFGTAVAMSSDGAQVVVGAYGDDDQGSTSGSVYVFDGATGEQLLKLVAVDGAGDDYFGTSVAMSSDGARVVVGACRDNDNDQDSHSGSVYVFDGATGAQLLKLGAVDGNGSDQFGCSVAVTSVGAWVVVGAHGDDDLGPGSGSAYVFDGASGEQLLKLVAEDGAGFDWFGYSVAVSSDGARVVVGAVARGSAYVFDGAEGAQLLRLGAADAAAEDCFGTSVAVSSDGAWIVVGAYGDDDQGPGSGSAYVFDGVSGAQLLKLQAADGAADDYFGTSVAMSSAGARVVVGAHGDDDQGSNSGSVYVFDGATGSQLLKLGDENGAASRRFGWSLAVGSDGAGVVVGTNVGSGSTYVFRIGTMVTIDVNLSTASTTETTTTNIASVDTDSRTTTSAQATTTDAVATATTRVATSDANTSTTATTETTTTAGATSTGYGEALETTTDLAQETTMADGVVQALPLTNSWTPEFAQLSRTAPAVAVAAALLSL